MECTKVKFSTREYADYHIGKHRKQAVKKGLTARSYLCSNCSCWHITSRVDYRELVLDNNELHTQITQLNGKVKDLEKQLKSERKALVCLDPVVVNLKKKIKRLEATEVVLRKSISELVTDKLKNEKGES